MSVMPSVAAAGDLISPGMGSLGAGLLQGATSLFGGMVGASGQAATNAQSFANSEMLFDQQQASIPMSQQYAQENAYNMRGTAYQATMADMKAAGLNPILASSLGATQGGTVGGMSIGSSNPVLGNPGAAMGAGIASAGQAASTMANVNATLQQAAKDRSAKELNEASSDTQRVLTGYHQAATDKMRNDSAVSAKQVDLVDQQTKTQRAQEQDALTSAGYNAARTITENSNAVTASHRARIAAQEAINAEKHGPGQYGDIMATLDRATTQGPVGFIRGWGEALYNKGREIVNQGTPGPGLVIDMNRSSKPGFVTHGGR